MMTRAPMGTTLPACTAHTLTHNGSALMSFLSLHLLLLCFTVSSSVLSVELRLLVMVRKIPLCSWFSGRLASVYFPLFQLEWSHVKMLCNTCNTRCGSSMQKPTFLCSPVLYRKTGEQLLPIYHLLLRFWHFFLLSTTIRSFPRASFFYLSCFSVSSLFKKN